MCSHQHSFHLFLSFSSSRLLGLVLGFLSILCFCLCGLSSCFLCIFLHGSRSWLTFLFASSQVYLTVWELMHIYWSTQMFVITFSDERQINRFMMIWHCTIDPLDLSLFDIWWDSISLFIFVQIIVPCISISFSINFLFARVICFAVYF